MIFEGNGKRPRCHPTARAAQSASLAGDVELCENSSVWYGAVLRGDKAGVRVGPGSNIQDNAVLHRASVGAGVTVGHGAVLDECTVEDDCLIGMNATVLAGAVIGAGSLVAAGTLVTEGTLIPPGSIVMGVPGKIRGTVNEKHKQMIAHAAGEYLVLAAEALPPAEE